jgi:hypothetical protein
MAGRSRALRFKLLLAFALVLVVGWSVLWFVAAAVVDRQAERVGMRLEAAGTMLNCANRSVKGFPFRIELRCGPGSRVANDAGSLALDGLTVVGLIYEPNLVIAEVRGPVVAKPAAAPEVEATWDLAHASARLDYGDQALDRFDVEVKNATLTLAGVPPLGADEIHVNVRRKPDAPADLEVAVRLVRAVLVAGETPLTLALQGEVPGGAALLSPRAETVWRDLAAAGLPVTIDSATLSGGDVVLAAAGSLVVKPDGRLDGSLDVALAGSENEIPLVRVVSPSAEKTMRTVLRNALAFAPETTIGTLKAKKVSLTIRDGRVTIGLIPVPLLTLPPIRLPG